MKPKHVDLAMVANELINDKGFADALEDAVGLSVDDRVPYGFGGFKLNMHDSSTWSQPVCPHFADPCRDTSPDYLKIDPDEELGTLTEQGYKWMRCITYPTTDFGKVISKLPETGYLDISIESKLRRWPNPILALGSFGHRGGEGFVALFRSRYFPNGDCFSDMKTEIVTPIMAYREELTAHALDAENARGSPQEIVGSLSKEHVFDSKTLSFNITSDGQLKSFNVLD